MEKIIIASAARTPIGKLGGSLSKAPATKLGAAAIRAAIERAGIDAGHVDGVIMGNVLSAGVGQAPARQAALTARVPPKATALTVNRVCASGLTAVALAAQGIRTGEAQVMVAGGMESMSQAPHLLMNSRSGIKLGDAQLVDSLVHDGLWCSFGNEHMGNYAEHIARKYGITRQEQDQYAQESHKKAAAAAIEGLFKGEITPVEVDDRGRTTTVDSDEGIRFDSSLEGLSKLSPAFDPQGTVTAGNASQISDGAAAMLVMSEEAAKGLKASPLAEITGYAASGIEPEDLFDAPVLAVRMLTEKIGMDLSDFDLIEMNEAFAAQCLANGKVLGWPWERVNVWGGAIALGHPIGASGARILTTLLHALKALNLHRGLAVLCHGGGGAVAMSVERLI